MTRAVRYHRAMLRRRSLRASTFAWVALGVWLAAPAAAQDATTQVTPTETAAPTDAATPATAEDTTAQAQASAAVDSTAAARASSAEAEDSSEQRPAVAPASGPDQPGGELDPTIVSGPPFGSRAAVQQSEPMAMRRVGQPDAIDPELPVALSFFVNLGAVMSSSYDDAIRSHAFGQSSPTLSMDGSITYGVDRWLHLGGRLGTRGRGWIRRDGEFAMASGTDLLAIAHARVHLGPVIDLGVVLGGGVGIAALSVHQTTVVGVSPRLHGAVQFGFRLTRGFHLFLRGSWDYFPWNDIDRYGSDVDLGGPFVGIGFEVKT